MGGDLGSVLKSSLLSKFANARPNESMADDTAQSDWTTQAGNVFG